MRKIFVVIGTRPEAIKMLPLVKELKRREDFEVRVCSSGQHGDLLLPIFDYFDVAPDFAFDALREGQELLPLTVRMLEYFHGLFKEQEPHAVLVHGDTTTAFCASLAAFYTGTRIGHVEAGLRTYNKSAPYPEEFNRCAIDAMTDFFFTPTEVSAKRLESEGRGQIFVTGNTVIDALRATVRSDYPLDIPSTARGKKLLLITTHRRENIGPRMREALCAIKDVLLCRRDVYAVFPVHPNPAVKSAADEIFADVGNIILCEPLHVEAFHNILARSYLVLSDSGGVQEEASYLGKPVLLLRENTERPELKGCGNVRLVGTCAERIKRELLLLLDNDFEYEKASRATSVCGDGFASRRIANLLEKLL